MKSATRGLPLLLAVGVASCSKEPPPASPPAATAKAVVVKVDGMLRGEGGKT